MLQVRYEAFKKIALSRKRPWQRRISALNLLGQKRCWNVYIRIQFYHLGRGMLDAGKSFGNHQEFQK